MSEHSGWCPICRNQFSPFDPQDFERLELFNQAQSLKSELAEARAEIERLKAEKKFILEQVPFYVADHIKSIVKRFEKQEQSDETETMVVRRAFQSP